MREAAFIKQNKNKWLKFEKALYAGSKSDPEKLAELFISVNNDLAYAQTYYPKSNVIRYLNAITATAYNKIYKKQKDGSGFRNFWSFEIPILMYRYRKYFYFSFAFFLFMMVIGVFSSIYEPDFVRSILGDYYVDMTEQNVKNGDPLAVYNNESSIGDFDSFFFILLNNLRVSIICFLYGIFAGVGTLYFLMVNGVMVGSFQYMFWENGNFFLSLRTIWMHGAMEIFSIGIVGGAGLLMGTSWMFPGVLSRRQAFFQKGKAALKILISTLPFITAAAVIEGFLTQHAKTMPLFASGLIVLGTFALIFWYYMIFPVRVYKKTQIGMSSLFKEVGYEKE